MTSLLCRLFIKDNTNTQDPKVRRAYGTLSSTVGILLNLLLAVGKLIVGAVSGAIAITADAVNNLSDAGSQVVSLISFKISAKPADRDHPFGHARMEYVSSMIVSFLVLNVGLDLLIESVKKVFSPETTSFNWWVGGVLAASVLVKLWLVLFNRRVAKRINSTVLRATAADSLSDAIATAAVLAGMIITHQTGFSTDAYLGIAVSVVILISGIKILIETKNHILGDAPDPEIVTGIHRLTEEYPDILGIHDLVVHSYGPGNTIASFHAEVDAKADIIAMHDMIDTVEKRIEAELCVHATVHMDPIVTDDEEVNQLRDRITQSVKAIDERLRIHDFRFVRGITHSNLIFDLVIPFEVTKAPEEIRREVEQSVKELDETFFTVMTIDRE